MIDLIGNFIITDPLIGNIQNEIDAIDVEKSSLTNLFTDYNF